MSGYVPDPTDATQPTDPIIAETAAAEFRALKGRVNNIVSGNTTGFGIRNILLNGAFDINQEFSTNLVIPTVTQYVTDQWELTTSTASILSFQMVGTPPPGYRIAAKLAVNVQRPTPAAAEAYLFAQPIEGFRMSQLQYGTASARGSTLLFWAQSSQLGTYNVTIRNNTAAPTRSYVATFTISAINTWTRYAISIPGDTLVSSTNWPPNGTGSDASVIFDFGSGSNFQTTTPNQWVAGNFVRSSTAAKFVTNPVGNVFLLGGLEWKDGTWTTNSTPERIPLELTQLMCQRYLNIITIAVLNGQNGFTWYSFPTVMRVAQPTITGGGAGFTLASGGNVALACFQTTSATQTLKLDARL